MAKLPEPPSAEKLRRLRPQIYRLGNLPLARVYFAGGDHPTHWNEFRRFGPTNARFDHHLPNHNGVGRWQKRAILYAATSAVTSLAEVFQETRRIDRVRKAPHLTVFRTQKELRLFDLTGAFPTRVGASMAIHSGPRARARRWAQAFYSAYPDLHGLYYRSSMNGGAPAVALTDRALSLGVLPEFPELDRPLNDDSLVDVLKIAADILGYALR